MARRIPTNVPFIDPNIGDAILGLTDEGAIKRVYSTTATLDFPSIAANLADDLTVTVNGAKVGDAVYIGAPAALESEITVMGFVSAADTVTVRAANNSAGAIDPASASYRIVVIGF